MPLMNNEDKKSECYEKLKSKYNKNKIKKDIYTLDQLKIALDDLLIEYAEGKGYRENHITTDVGNTIGIISTILASIVTFVSIYYKFEDIKNIVFVCTTAYFGFNTFFFLFLQLFGGKIAFKEFDAITKIDTTPVYVILLYWKNRNIPVKYHRDVTELFYEDGEFDHTLFLNDLESLFKE